MDYKKMLEFYENELMEHKMMFHNDVDGDREELRNKIKIFEDTISLIKREIKTK